MNATPAVLCLAIVVVTQFVIIWVLCHRLAQTRSQRHDAGADARRER
jgi:hypothetical protein